MLIPLLALALAAAPVATPELRTLRVDYFHTGGAAEERFALAGVVQEGRWAGPPAGDRWLDDSNLGKYRFEVIDPATLEVKRPGEEGELVLTTITKEGFPLVRYRTGDLTTLDPSPCRCGRTLARMARIRGRIDDMINLGDVKAFPSQVEEVLAGTEGVEPHYELVVDRVDGMDTLEVRVEIAEDMPEVDEVRAIERLKERIARRLAASLGIPVKVSLAEPKSLARAGEGKLRRVVDRRQL